MYGDLCEPWPTEWCCNLVGAEPAIETQALMSASEILWMATGRRFGNCAVQLRPCRQDCLETSPIPTQYWWSSGMWSSGWPYPALHEGVWINLACGLCTGDCSCSTSSEILLNDKVNSIVDIVIDGVSLPASGYAFYDGQKLVKASGEWPLCQDWSVTGGPGTWIVEATFGASVPMLGQEAVSVLACEIAKLCAGVDCNLPPHVTRVVRQGVTMERINPQDILDSGLTGLYLPDLFIRTFNPNNLKDRARAYSPDVFTPRIQ